MLIHPEEDAATFTANVAGRTVGKILEARRHGSDCYDVYASTGRYECRKVPSHRPVTDFGAALEVLCQHYKPSEHTNRERRF